MQNPVLTVSVPTDTLAVFSKVTVAAPPSLQKDRMLLWTEAKAKWDTGAQICSISKELCDRMGFVPRIRIPVSSISGTVHSQQDIILIDVMFDGYFFPVLASVIDTMPGADCDMLIGMNLIMQGDFSLSLAEGKINMTFKPYPGTIKKFVAKKI